MFKITVKAPPPEITTGDCRERALRERVATLEAAATALLAALDGATHPEAMDAVYAAEDALRAVLKGTP